jgi:hypothetical protein
MSINEAVADQAVANFKNGYNCAQSVLLALICIWTKAKTSWFQKSLLALAEA